MTGVCVHAWSMLVVVPIAFDSEKMFRTLLSFVFLVAATVNVLAAEPDAKKSKVDPSGTWRSEQSFGSRTILRTLRLNMDKEGKMTGTQSVQFNDTERPPITIKDVQLEGNKLTFRTSRVGQNGQEFTMLHEGIVSDKGIAGLSKINFNGNEPKFEWNSKRVVESVDVVGTWLLRFEMPNGNVVEPTLNVSSDGKELKGTFVSRLGEREIKDLSIKDSQLVFQFTFERDGNSVVIAYKGCPRGDSMKGTFESNFGGQSMTLEVDGNRASKKEKSDDKGEADESQDQ